jgi:hypothetical protein
MNATHRRRLEKLAEFLQTLPPKKFTIGQWMNLDHTPKEAFIEIDANYCGTAGCALGWATTIPSFRKAGLRLYSVKNFWGDSSTQGEVYLIDPKTNEKITDNFGAAAQFFGTGDDTDWIFCPDFYINEDKVTPKIVAARIRKVLEKEAKKTVEKKSKRGAMPQGVGDLTPAKRVSKTHP